MQQGLAAPIDEQLAQRIRNGDLTACRFVVDREGANVLRFAYLLSGQQARAIDLAADGFVAYLLRLRQSTVTEQPQHDLALGITERFLAAPTSPESDDDTRIVPFTGGPAGRHFSVEDERTRLRAALARLTPDDRAVLLLHQFIGVPTRQIAALLEKPEPEILAKALDLRERVADAAGINPDLKLAGPLAAAAMPVTRSELWELIEDPLRARLEAERRRELLMTWGVAAAALVMVIGLVLIIAGNPFGNSGDTDDTVLAVPSVTGRDTELPVTELTPEIAPTATATPAAEVTDALYAYRSNGNQIEMLQANREEPSTLQPLPLSEEGLSLAGEPVVSPDGDLVAMTLYEENSEEFRGVLRVFDRDLSNIHWEVELTRAPLEDRVGERPPFLLVAAIDRERIWVAIHYWDSAEPVRLQTYDLESGEEQQEITTNLPGFVAHDIQLIASPALNSVHLFTISQEEPPLVGQLQMVYIAYDPEGNRLYSKTLTDLPDSRVFFIYGASLTPDGHHLYGLEYTESWREVAVHFFDLEDGSIERRIRLPFQQVADPLPFQQTMSHDGRWLYVISPMTAEIAIVDVEQRELHAHIPLDMSELPGDPIDRAYVDADEMVLAPDGRTLYALGLSRGAEAPDSAGVWEIDMATWSVTRHLLPDSHPDGIFLDPSGEKLYLQNERPRAAEPNATLTELDLETGVSRTLPDIEGGRFRYFAMVDLYRSQYGKSPRIPNLDFAGPGQESALANPLLTVGPPMLEAGERLDLEVLFTDPWSGDVIDPGDTSGRVRYTVPDIVQVTLRPGGGGNAQVVNLGPAGEGRFRGTAMLNEGGTWSAELTISWDDSPNRQVRVSRDVVRVSEPARRFPGGGNLSVQNRVQ